MNITRYGLDHFHKHMNYNDHTLILAPRQSGKTLALVRKFIETRDSVLMVPNSNMRRVVDDYLVRLECPSKLRDVHTMNSSSIRGRRVDTIFLDEVDCYQDNIQNLWAQIAPALTGRLVAVTTPTGRRPLRIYEDIFYQIYNMAQDKFIRTIPTGATELMKVDHFDKELFKI